MRIGISRSPVRALGGVRANDTFAWLDAVDDAKWKLDRAIRELEAAKRERDEAIAIARVRLRSTKDEAPSMSSTALKAEEREKIWAKLEDLERRAAETDRRIEERKEDIALLIERLRQLRKRLERYC